MDSQVEKLVTRKRDIKPRSFDNLYKNKIEPDIEVGFELKFGEMKLLLDAYEYWRYTKENEKAVEDIQREMLE